MAKNIILVLLLLCGTLQAQNFSGNEKITAYAEECRLNSYKFWGVEPQPWKVTCPITYDPNHGGGVTTFGHENNVITSMKMTVGGNNTESTIAHEVDHAVRHSIGGRVSIERWLDEGCSQQFEDEDHSYYIQIARQNKNGVKLSTLSNMNYQPSDYNNQLLYAFGYTAVQMLLERDTPQTLLCFQFDERPMDERFKAYYGMSSEEFMEYWRNNIDSFEAKKMTPYPAGYPVIQFKPVCTIWLDDSPLSKLLQKDMAKDPLQTFLLENYYVRVVYKSPVNALWARMNWITRYPCFVIPASRQQFVYNGDIDELISQLKNRPYIRGTGGILSPLDETPTPTTPKPEITPTLPAIDPITIVPPKVEPQDKPKDIIDIVKEVVDPPKPKAEIKPPTIIEEEDKPAFSLNIGEKLQFILPGAANILGWLATAGIIAVPGGIGAYAGYLGIAKVALPLIMKWWRAKRQDGATFPEKQQQKILPRYLGEACQLLQLRQQEGHIPVLDSLRGMLVDDKIKNLLDSDDTDPKIKEFVREFKIDLDKKVNDITPPSTRAF